MKVLKLFLAVMFLVTLCAGRVIASEKGSGYESKGSGMKGGHAETEDVAVSGDIRFADYYSMGGEKCAAFMETEDGTTLCIIDNMAASKLKKEIGGKGRVKVMGVMEKSPGAGYLTIEEYEIIEKAPEKKGSGYEHKDS